MSGTGFSIDKNNRVVKNRERVKMTTEGKTITRALVELKTIDKKIQKKIDTSGFIAFSIGKFPVAGYITNEEAEKDFKANFDSVNDLIKRRNALKSAVVKSNAVVVVNINGEKLTVAESIERKNSIQLHKDFLYQMKSQHQNCVKRIEEHTSKVDNVVSEITGALAGKQAKLKDDDIKRIEEIASESHKAQLCDPNKLRTEIDKLEEYIVGFEREVDIVLSESNTKSEIQV